MPGLFLAAQSLQIYFVKPLQQQAINCRKLSHQTHAEALHIELALMAAPVGGFGQLRPAIARHICALVAMSSGALEGFVLCAA